MTHVLGRFKEVKMPKKIEPLTPEVVEENTAPVVEEVKEIKEEVVAPKPVKPLAPANKEYVAVVKDCERLNIRQFPVEGALIMGTLSKGDKVDVINYNKDDKFHKVAFKGRVLGYVNAKFVSVK